MEEGEAEGSDEALTMEEQQLTVDIQAHRYKTKHLLSERLAGVNQVRLSEELFEYL